MLSEAGPSLLVTPPFGQLSDRLAHTLEDLEIWLRQNDGSAVPDGPPLAVDRPAPVPQCQDPIPSDKSNANHLFELCQAFIHGKIKKQIKQY